MCWCQGPHLNPLLPPWLWLPGHESASLSWLVHTCEDYADWDRHRGSAATAGFYFSRDTAPYRARRDHFGRVAPGGRVSGFVYTGDDNADDARSWAFGAPKHVAGRANPRGPTTTTTAARQIW